MKNSVCSMTAIAPAGQANELVRGNEQWLLERLAPVVRHQSVVLDLSLINRIDAAGIATLITLYACAQEFGNQLSVSAASERVAALLSLVGLDRILMSHNAVQAPHSAVFQQVTAA